MNFCPKCDFMLYTKRIPDGDTGNFKLKNYCRNCTWEGEYSSDGDERIIVYKRNYTNEFLTEQSSLSDNIINDPTLPRISNIKCVNTKCLTNIDDHNVYEITNFSDQDIIFIKENFSNIVSENENKIIIKLNDEENISVFDSSETDMLVNKFVKPNREVIFMKYDPLNLKYMYYCTTCFTTWKND